MNHYLLRNLSLRHCEKKPWLLKHVEDDALSAYLQLGFEMIKVKSERKRTSRIETKTEGK